MADEIETSKASAPKPAKQKPAEDDVPTFPVSRIKSNGDRILKRNKHDVAGALSNLPDDKELSVEAGQAIVDKWLVKKVRS